MKNGHLFLATMADGSIIEFEPLPPVVAVVLGEQIRAGSAQEVQSAIISRLFDDYAASHGIQAADAEVDSWIDNLRRGMQASGLTAEEELTAEETEQLAHMRRKMGQSIIRQWKINRALYRQYGGRIIYQQLGPEPLDAYRQFLQEQQAAGAFRIVDPAFEDEFWWYFTDDSMHTFMERGSEDEAGAFTVPPWELTAAAVQKD